MTTLPVGTFPIGVTTIPSAKDPSRSVLEGFSTYCHRTVAELFHVNNEVGVAGHRIGVLAVAVDEVARQP